MQQERASPGGDVSGDMPSTYVHVDKQVRACAPVIVGDGLLKWYEVAPPDDPVSPEIASLALNFVEREAQNGALAVSGDLGFVILHRCGGDFHFLLPGIWRNANELWESVYAKDGPEVGDFSLFSLPGPNRATYCVWELRAVWHEQQAWRRYLLSARDAEARREWLADCYEGPC